MGGARLHLPTRPWRLNNGETPPAGPPDRWVGHRARACHIAKTRFRPLAR
jgi:hypothetical protein